MWNAPNELLTGYQKFDEQISIVLVGLGHFGVSQDSFIELSRSLLNAKGGNFKPFCQKFRRFLPMLIDQMARSHPATTEFTPLTKFRETGAASIRAAIAAEVTDAILEDRGWDIGEAVTYICSDYEQLKRYGYLSEDDAPLQWTQPDDGDTSQQNVVPIAVYYDLVNDLLAFMDTIATERASLAVHIDEALA